MLKFPVHWPAAAGLLLTALSIGVSADDPQPKSDAANGETRVEIREVITSDEAEADDDPDQGDAKPEGKDKAGRKESKQVRVQRSGRITIVGPDGKKQEFEIPFDGAELRLDDVKGLDLKPEDIQGVLRERMQKKPMIGVVLAPVSEDLAPHLNLEPGEGAMIVQVRENSPAAKAGLVKSDIITHLNGEKVSDFETLQQQIEQHVEEELQLRVIHSGKPREVSLKAEVMELPMLRWADLDEDWEKMPPDIQGKVKVLRDMEKKGGVVLFDSGIHLPPELAELHAKAAQEQARAAQAQGHAQEMQAMAEELQQLREELKQLRELILSQQKEAK